MTFGQPEAQRPSPPSADLDTSWRVIAAGPSITTPSRVRVPGASVDAYSSDRWRLDALGQAARHRRPPSLNFVNARTPIPPEFDATLRRASYLLVNIPTPQILLDRAGSNTARWLGPGSISLAFRSWVTLVRWLHQHGVHALSEADQTALDDFRKHLLSSGIARATVGQVLMSLSRLEALGDQLPPDDRLPTLPWSPDEIGSYFIKRKSSDNATSVIETERIGPLIVWAVQWVTEFAPDILAAREATERIAAVASAKGRTPSGRTTATDWVRRLPSGTVLPGLAAGKISGYALGYLTGMNGLTCSREELGVALRERDDLSFDAQLPQPLPVPVAGRIDSRPWRAHLDYRDFERHQHLVSYLRTACIIVVAYLTGIRPHEAMNLGPECYERVELPTGTVRHLIHGVRYKGLRDDADMQDLEGKPHTWVTLDLGAKAIEVSRQLDRGPQSAWLWPTAANRRRREGAGADEPRPPLSIQVVNLGIARFIRWCNQTTYDLGLDTTLEIPDGEPITMSRFRRTLAYHIDAQPDGEVALGLQYGHLGTRSNLVDTATGGGYAGTQARGRLGLMPKDEASKFVRALESLQDELHGGGGVSGPAADRAINAARKSEATFPGAILTDSEAKELLRDPDLQVYDNPFAFTICVFEAATAACLTRSDEGNAKEPILPDCVRNCVNRAMTDAGAAQMARHADQLLTQAATQPLPLAHRLQAKADVLRNEAASHDQHRITLADRDD